MWLHRYLTIYRKTIYQLDTPNMLSQMIKNHIKRVWKGEEPFWKVFLIWWIGGTFVAVTLIANLLKFTEDNNFHFSEPYQYIPGFPIFLLNGLYFLFLIISAVRRLFGPVSRDNYLQHPYLYLYDVMKFIIVVILSLFLSLLTLYLYFLLSISFDSTICYGFCIWKIIF